MPSSGEPDGGRPPAAGAGRFLLAGREVARLGLGAMRLTGTRPFDAGRPRDRTASIAVLRRAVDLGVDHIDTAAFYFSRTRSANELICSALAPYDGLTIATKVGPTRDRDGSWGDGLPAGGLRAQVEDNLRQLGRDRLDLVYYRRTAALPVVDGVAELAALVDDGTIGHVGISGVTLAELEAARAVHPVAAVQNRLSVDKPGDLAVLERCGELGIPYVPFFTVSGDAGSGRPGAQPDAVTAVAEELDATPAQVRLAWTLSLGSHVLAIPGTGDRGHLEDNVAAAGLRLSPAHRRLLAA